MNTETRDAYEAPTVMDYGDLVELTAASGFTANEDGGSKLLIHHTAPSSP
jgi:hypothetical protein